VFLAEPSPQAQFTGQFLGLAAAFGEKRTVIHSHRRAIHPHADRGFTAIGGRNVQRVHSTPEGFDGLAESPMNPAQIGLRVEEQAIPVSPVCQERMSPDQVYGIPGRKPGFAIPVERPQSLRFVGKQGHVPATAAFPALNAREPLIPDDVNALHCHDELPIRIGPTGQKKSRDSHTSSA